MSKTLISVLAGLGGMFGWGTSDFLANSASDKVGHFKTFFWSQIAGLGLVSAIALVMLPSFVFTPLLWALIVVSGVAYALGYLLFYNGFEIGNVSVVSAVINLQNLFIIGIAYFLYGQRLSAIQIPALILLIIGVLLVSVNFKDLKKGKVSLLKGVKETMLAAVMFGVFYWPVNEYIVERGDWLATNVLTKVVAIAAVFLIAKYQGKGLTIAKKSRSLFKLIAAVGLLEAIGVLSVSFGISIGDSIIVNPIASALTVVTVLLAIIFLKEKITRSQAIGIIATVGGILMIGLG